MLIIGVLIPAILAALLLFPVYTIWCYRLIVAEGESEKIAALGRRFERAGIALTLASYIFLGVAIFLPTILPALSSFIENGGLGVMVPLLLVNVALGQIFSRERALRRRSSNA